LRRWQDRGRILETGETAEGKIVGEKREKAKQATNLDFFTNNTFMSIWVYASGKKDG